jgi:hypothetical protein
VAAAKANVSSLKGKKRKDAMEKTVVCIYILEMFVGICTILCVLI